MIKNGYGKYIKQYEVNFSENTGGIQLTYCISEEGLKEILKYSRIGRLNIEQKRAMNEVCKYLDMNIKSVTAQGGWTFMNYYIIIE